VRGLTISAHGGLDRLELRDDLAVPALVSDTQVRVRILAAALNHLDLFVVGGLPNVHIVPPWILGSDAMGTIDAVGDAVSGLGVGDRVLINPGLSDRTCAYCLAGEQPLCPRFGVLGEHVPGTLTEQIVLPAANVRRVALDADPVEGAAFTLSTLTAWRMLVSRARLTAGVQLRKEIANRLPIEVRRRQIGSFQGRRSRNMPEKLRHVAFVGTHRVPGRVSIKPEMLQERFEMSGHVPRPASRAARGGASPTKSKSRRAHT